ncbi:MAG: crossover junction endodeoxyribonuclease RuvC [Gammaproteobacteria bacterium]
MGLDPGLAATGWGVIESGAAPRHLASGVIRTSPSSEHIARLDWIFRQTAAVAEEWKPQKACVERVFANMNGKTSMALGEARGAAIAALSSRGVQITELSALQIKKSVTGAGRANKSQIAQMIPLLLNDTPKLRADAADALACALALTPLAAHSSRLPPFRSGRRRR